VYLLDTNHCSNLIDKNPIIYKMLTNLGTTQVATCAIVRGELRYMVEKSTRKLENEVKVNEFLSGIEIFPVDDSAADFYGKIKARLISKYGPTQRKPARKVRLKDIGFSDNDLWIAAVAVDKGFTVVSSDSDFPRIKAAFADLRYETWLPS
jgi:tRNA(fMet)-specific endonuclease VapC